MSTDTLNNIETITHKLLLESKNEELGTVTEITLESAKCYAEKNSPVSSCKSKFHLGQFKVGRPDSNQVEIDRTRSDKRVSYQQLEMNVDVESSKFRIEFRHFKDSELKEIFEVEFGHMYGGKLERLTGEIILDAKKVSKTSKTVVSTASKKTGSSSKWSGLTVDILPTDDFTHVRILLQLHNLSEVTVFQKIQEISAVLDVVFSRGVDELYSESVVNVADKDAIDFYPVLVDPILVRAVQQAVLVLTKETISMRDLSMTHVREFIRRISAIQHLFREFFAIRNNKKQ